MSRGERVRRFARAPVSWRAPGPARDREPAGWTLHHIPALDGIRGLAVVAVLLFHGDTLVGGYLGVDAFFVLSGFLITSLLLGEVRATHRVDFAAFWTRRARRLLPALFVLLVGVALFALFVATSSDLGRIRSDALATLGYVANWHSISSNDAYWRLFENPSPLDHTWSLAIEEQFYLVWPLVVFVIAWFVARRQRGMVESTGRHTARSVLVLSSLLVVVSTGWMASLVEPGRDPSRAYFGTDTRAASILIGAALAAVLALRGPVRSTRGRVVLEMAGIVSFVALGVAWATVEGESTELYRGGFLLCGIAVAIVIAAVVHPLRGPISKVLSVGPLCVVGVISYGLYLWHWPIYLVLNETRTGLDGAALLALRIALSVAVAGVSFVVVERPIRRGALSGRRIVFVAPAAALVCIAVVVVATVGATAPLRGPDLSVSASRPNAGVVEPGPNRRGLGASAQVLVVGDSVATPIGGSTATIERGRGKEAGTASMAGCLLDEGIGARAIIHEAIQSLEPGHSCVPTWVAGRDELLPDNIVIIYGSAAGFQELELQGTWAGPCDRVYEQWYMPLYRKVVRSLMQGDTTVSIVRLPHLTSAWAPSDSGSRIDCVNKMHKLVAAELPGVRILDLAAFVCPRGQCREEIDGVQYRVDGMHYSVPAASQIARWLVRRIDDAPTTATP